MTYQKVRRSGRITIAVPILLIGSDSEGRVFSEETKTVIISLHGAGILSRHKLASEQELVLRSLESNCEADMRVGGEIGVQDDVAFVNETLDLWKTSFPPPEAPQDSVSSLSLECASCTTPLVLEHGDFEFDVCVTHGGLVRYCDHCGFATVWKFASIHIAVPFARESPQAPAIFVLARIANINPIPDSELFRCGVAFLPLR
jgi:hypothetical protein